jgi:hypothetical protein
LAIVHRKHEVELSCIHDPTFSAASTFAPLLAAMFLRSTRKRRSESTRHVAIDRLGTVHGIKFCLKTCLPERPNPFEHPATYFCFLAIRTIIFDATSELQNFMDQPQKKNEQSTNPRELDDLPITPGPGLVRSLEATPRITINV